MKLLTIDTSLSLHCPSTSTGSQSGVELRLMFFRKRDFIQMATTASGSYKLQDHRPLIQIASAAASGSYKLQRQ